MIALDYLEKGLYAMSRTHCVNTMSSKPSATAANRAA